MFLKSFLSRREYTYIHISQASKIAIILYAHITNYNASFKNIMSYDITAVHFLLAK